MYTKPYTSAGGDFNLLSQKTMAIQFKQKCSRCRKNYVVTTSRQRYVQCYDCEKSALDGEITDPEMKKLFDIPEEFYMENAFLRDIKINYLRYGKLSDKQVAAFVKTVKKMESNSAAQGL